MLSLVDVSVADEVSDTVAATASADISAGVPVEDASVVVGVFVSFAWFCESAKKSVEAETEVPIEEAGGSES